MVIPIQKDHLDIWGGVFRSIADDIVVVFGTELSTVQLIPNIDSLGPLEGCHEGRGIVGSGHSLPVHSRRWRR
ncbi:hypothetical protein ES707_22080 [subsurface metagenome]